MRHAPTACFGREEQPPSAEQPERPKPKPLTSATRARERCERVSSGWALQRGFAMGSAGCWAGLDGLAPLLCHLRRPPAAPTGDWRRSCAAWPHQPGDPARARAGRREPRPMATLQRPPAARDRSKVSKSSAPSFFVPIDTSVMPGAGAGGRCCVHFGVGDLSLSVEFALAGIVRHAPIAFTQLKERCTSGSGAVHRRRRRCRR
jgi:hypothetical protein